MSASGPAPAIALSPKKRLCWCLAEYRGVARVCILLDPTRVIRAAVTDTSLTQQTETVYEPSTRRLPNLHSYLLWLWERRPFIWHLARTRIKARNYDTLLGQVWLVLNPVLMAAVWVLVRTVIRPVDEADLADTVTHIILGMFMFQYFSNMVSEGARSIISNRRMVLNMSLPRMVFPIADMFEALYGLVPTVLVYVLVQELFGQPFTWALLTFPVFVFLLTVFAFGMMLLLSTVTVFFRDTTNFIRYVLRLWMFSSPILYKVSEIPPNLLPYLQLNPLFPFFAAFEQMFDGKLPDVGYLFWATAWALTSLMIGAYFFLTREHEFAPRL